MASPLTTIHPLKQKRSGEVASRIEKPTINKCKSLVRINCRLFFHRPFDWWFNLSLRIYCCVYSGTVFKIGGQLERFFTVSSRQKEVDELFIAFSALKCVAKLRSMGSYNNTELCIVWSSDDSRWVKVAPSLIMSVVYTPPPNADNLTQFTNIICLFWGRLITGHVVGHLCDLSSSSFTSSAEYHSPTQLALIENGTPRRRRWIIEYRIWKHFPLCPSRATAYSPPPVNILDSVQFSCEAPMAPVVIELLNRILQIIDLASFSSVDLIAAHEFKNSLCIISMVHLAAALPLSIFPPQHHPQ